MDQEFSHVGPIMPSGLSYIKIRFSEAIFSDKIKPLIRAQAFLSFYFSFLTCLFAQRLWSHREEMGHKYLGDVKPC